MQDTQKGVTIQDIIAKRKEHARRVESKLILKAYNYAVINHGDQCRKSGEPYMIHPVNVAYILSELGMDDETLCAALLHDVVEDTPKTHEDLVKDFGESIAEMVAGVTKLGTLRYTSKEEVAEYLYLFGHLPDNFITKKEAKALGWVSKEGNLGEVAPGKSIGGDYFGNYEGNLPEKKGRSYYECDIDSDGGYRGSKRIVFSDDGLIYYTEDHYETFDLLYGEE